MLFKLQINIKEFCSLFTTVELKWTKSDCIMCKLSGLIYASDYRQLSFIIVGSTHYRVLINVALSIFDGFRCRCFLMQCYNQSQDI